MKVVLVAETFTPAVNGVVNSVLRVADELAARGHRLTVIAPSGQSFRTSGGTHVEVLTVPARSLPGYRGLLVARPSGDLRARVREMLLDLDPDVVHLASPAILGGAAGRAAEDLDIPTVAVYQTDLSAFVTRYRLTPAGPPLWRWLRSVHNRADLTLVPSTASANQLRRHGIGPLELWGRGVDAVTFHPLRRDEQARAALRGGTDDLLVGYVGRLAAEKRVDLLGPVSRLPGVRLVVVGDGPRRPTLQRTLPDAVFTGQLTGPALARTMAGLDLLVHPGVADTFCQVIQEALCSGVPVVAAAAGGPLDLVQHGRNGWLWPDGHPALLAAQVARLAEDRSALAAAAAQARPSVAHRTWGLVTDQLVGHYGRAIARRGAPARPSVITPAAPVRLPTAS